MSILDRVRSFFTPTVDLREQVDRLQSERNTLIADLAALHKQNAELEGELKAARIEVDRAKYVAQSNIIGRDEAERAARRMAEQLLETSAALEEANARIATLEAQLRDRDEDAQLALIHAPAGDEEPAQPAEDEVISDITAVFAYQIRGLFFEGRHHWELARGEERVKAPINDKHFLDEMAARKVFFAAGDALRADMHIVTYRKPAGEVYVKYSVEKVLQILPPDQQKSLITEAPATAVSIEGGDHAGAH